MRRSRKALAASFVVTFVAGCDSKPSQPPATPTVDVGTTPVPTAAASATPAPSDSAAGAAASASAAATAPALPPAPTVGRVVRADDGTCTWFPSLPPRPPGGRVFANPPPPHRVQCPPGDGGS